ncbi:MAG: hypothetical protein FWE08_01175 [Oscillospiraceae bacterium]|nr:hypothetical protein [Oscillospiraceae bacterium]
MKRKNKVLRALALGLQILAILAYFIPSLFLGGHVGMFWLAAGVIHTAAFCVMFFRDAHKRTAFSIILLITIILWILFLLSLAGGLMAVWMAVPPFSPIVVYSYASLLAAALTLAAPRRVHAYTSETA